MLMYKVHVHVQRTTQFFSPICKHYLHGNIDIVIMLYSDYDGKYVCSLCVKSGQVKLYLMSVSILHE